MKPPKPLKNPVSTRQTETVPASIGNDVVARAYRKIMAKEALSREEQRAVERHEKQKEERLRWQYYRTIPQKHWKAMSGRQTKVLAEQASLYGIPFGSASIDLPAVVKALHEFLAGNAQKLSVEEDMGSGSPALERWRRERATMARMDRLERQRRMLPREEVRQAMGRAAAVLRGAGEALGRQFGPGAVDILHEALDDLQREVDRSLGDPTLKNAVDVNADVTTDGTIAPQPDSTPEVLQPGL